MYKNNSTKEKLKVLLVGCPLDSGNGGVTALGYSAITNLVKRIPDIEILIQHNSGKQEKLVVDVEGRTIVLRTIFFHQSSSLLETQGLKLLRLIAPFLAKVPGFIRAKLIRRFRLFAALDEVDAVLDISGGDSFTSIYGGEVFDSIARVKMIAIFFQVPLYLLPQSYGPFTSPKHVNSARFIFENTRLISCRDAHGKSLVSALAPRVEKSQFIESPDIVFSMETISSKFDLFNKESNTKKVIGLNVSGLLYFGDKSFGLNFEYQEMVHSIVEWVLDSSDALLLLVPHVVGTAKQHLVAEKTDVNAIATLCDRYSNRMKSRIFNLEEYVDPRVLKGIIGECDIFLGARMHACIGAISQGIPTLCHSYSDKFIGVMGMVEMESTVVDLRNTTIENVLLQLDQILTMKSDRQSALDNMKKHKIDIDDFFDIATKDIFKLIKR